MGAACTQQQHTSSSTTAAALPALTPQHAILIAWNSAHDDMAIRLLAM
jgi:hypothetical protein